MPTTVLFDLSPPDYYRDVLDILALPVGAHYRYEYRKKWFSLQALEVYESARLPTDCLLVYAQSVKHRRGSPIPTTGSLSAKDILLGTRYAKITRSELTGEHVSFHFRVRGYPDPEDTKVRAAIEALLSSGQVPFTNLVGFLPEVDLIDPERGNQDMSWQGIVRGLGSAPSQFEGSRFWRFDRVTNAQQVDLLPKTWGKDSDPGAAPGYVLREDAEFSLILQCFTPEGIGGESIDVGSVTVSLEPPDLGVFTTAQTQALRRYGDRRFQIWASHIATPRSRSGMVSVMTDRKEADWPSGAELRLRVRVAKDWLRFVAGVVLFLLGAAALLMAWNEKDNLGAAVALLLPGAVALTYGFYLITGRLSPKSR